MKQTYRRIGILTSGGDAPGMNAAIRAITYAALEQGVEVMGIYEGYAGLLGGDMKLFSEQDVADAERKGGTLLYSARCDEFRREEGVRTGVARCRAARIDGLVVIGGDGTFRGAQALCRAGIPCIGVPASIDNDIAATEACIGFDTAVNTAVRMIDCLRDTSESHARCNLVEVMGRSCGQIALASGIGVGAVGIAVPEFPFDTEALLRRIEENRRAGSRDFPVIIAEGMHAQRPDYTAWLAKEIGDRIGIETRTTVLGHVIRGGTPSAYDRILAASLGSYAVSLLLQGAQNFAVGVRNGEPYAVSMEEAMQWDSAYRALFPLTDEVPSAEQADAPYLCRVRRMQARYHLSQMLSRT